MEAAALVLLVRIRRRLDRDQERVVADRHRSGVDRPRLDAGDLPRRLTDDHPGGGRDAESNTQPYTVTFANAYSIAVTHANADSFADAGLSDRLEDGSAGPL